MKNDSKESYYVIDWANNVLAKNWKVYTNESEKDNFSKESIELTAQLFAKINNNIKGVL